MDIKFKIDEKDLVNFISGKTSVKLYYPNPNGESSYVEITDNVNFLEFRKDNENNTIVKRLLPYFY